MFVKDMLGIQMLFSVNDTPNIGMLLSTKDASHIENTYIQEGCLRH